MWVFVTSLGELDECQDIDTESTWQHMLELGHHTSTLLTTMFLCDALTIQTTILKVHLAKYLHFIVKFESVKSVCSLTKDLNLIDSLVVVSLAVTQV